MKLLIRILTAVFVLSCFPAWPANAQQGVQYLVVSSCGILPATPPVGTFYWGTMLANGTFCDQGGGGGGGASVTQRASVAAVTAGTGQPLYGDSANGAVLFEPVKPGTTTAIDLSAPSGVFGVDGATIASATNLFPTSSAAVSGALADGSLVTLGTKADAATCATTNTLLACTRQLHADLIAALPAGTNSIGAVTPATNGSGAISIVQADSSAALNVSTATTTQLVALSAGKKIYVTSFDVIAGGTGNITFEYGTGTTCGTGTTILTGVYNLTAQAGISKGNGLGPVLVVPAGNALCILTTAAVQMSGSVSYAQF